MIKEKVLKELYIDRKLSMQEIARKLGCSVNKVRYWSDKYAISRRSISEAVYARCNPNGDPFKFRLPQNSKEAELYGLGIGLYWGEGTKANKNSVRLGNTDPELINKFIDFLVTFFSLKREDFRFYLQIFTDIDTNKAMDFWAKSLRIKKHQISKPVITISGSIGTYRKKSLYGVMTVMYHNKKLRDLMVDLLPNKARVAQW